MSAVISLDQSQRDLLARMNALHLKGFAEGMLTQWETLSVFAGMSFEERLRDLLSQQEDVLRAGRARNLLAASKIKTRIDFNEICVNPDRGFSSEQKAELASLRFISTLTNIVVQGASGSGKSTLIGALGRLCCKCGYSTLYYNTYDLLTLLNASDYRQKNKLRAKLVRTKVLILDDIGLQPLNQALALELFTVLEDRINKGPVIIGTQLSSNGLAKAMACNQQTTDANMRRITQCSIKITLVGDAYSMAGMPPRAAQEGNDG